MAQFLTPQLGDRVRDRVSGYEGMVFAFTTWLHGCVHLLVRPQVDKDGNFQEGEFFDIQQLQVLERAAYWNAMKAEQQQTDQVSDLAPLVWSEALG